MEGIVQDQELVSKMNTRIEEVRETFDKEHFKVTMSEDKVIEALIYQI